MKHVIVAREIVGTAQLVWDDETGLVSGDHSQAAELGLAIAGPMTAYCPWGSVRLTDPGHDSADFLIALRYVLWWPLHIELPESLRYVAPTPYPPAPGGAMGDVVGDPLP